MKKIAYLYISSCQLSVQEALYNVLPELWFRKSSPGISFINTNLRNNRIRMIKSKEELELLPDICITENCLSCSVRIPLLQKSFFR